MSDLVELCRKNIAVAEKFKERTQALMDLLALIRGKREPGNGQSVADVIDAFPHAGAAWTILEQQALKNFRIRYEGENASWWTQTTSFSVFVCEILKGVYYKTVDDCEYYPVEKGARLVTDMNATEAVSKERSSTGVFTYNTPNFTPLPAHLVIRALLDSVDVRCIGHEQLAAWDTHIRVCAQYVESYRQCETGNCNYEDDTDSVSNCCNCASLADRAFERVKDLPALFNLIMRAPVFDSFRDDIVERALNGREISFTNNGHEIVVHATAAENNRRNQTQIAEKEKAKQTQIAELARQEEHLAKQLKRAQLDLEQLQTKKRAIE